MKKKLYSIIKNVSINTLTLQMIRLEKTKKKCRKLNIGEKKDNFECINKI